MRGGSCEGGAGGSRTEQIKCSLLTSPKPATFLYAQSRSDSFVICPASTHHLQGDPSAISPGTPPPPQKKIKGNSIKITSHMIQSRP